jgi:hypothetical protein
VTPTHENGPGDDARPAPANHQYPQHTTPNNLSDNDKWREDWRRRLQRAAVNDGFFEVCPRGVREAAQRIRAGEHL